MPLSIIKQMEMLSRQTPGTISLSQGIPFGGTDKAIRRFVIKALNDGLVDKYTPVAGILELRNLIEKKNKDHGFNYSAETETIVTVGGMEGMAATILSLVKPGDEVIIFEPVYTYYKKLILLAGGTPVIINLLEKDGWQPDLTALRKAITAKTKLIVVSSPNNPTGTITAQNLLKEIGSLAVKNNIYILSDEVYKSLVYNKSGFFSLASVQQFRKQVIRVVSLSKDFSMTGWRLGYLNFDIHLADKITSVHDSLVNCAPAISQYAAIAALKNETRLVRRAFAIYRRNHSLTLKYLHALKDKLSFVEPDSAYYAFVKIKGIKDTLDMCRDMVLKRRVAVVPGKAFGDNYAAYIRIAFGKETSIVEEGLKRFSSYLLDA